MITSKKYSLAKNHFQGGKAVFGLCYARVRRTHRSVTKHGSYESGDNKQTIGTQRANFNPISNKFHKILFIPNPVFAEMM